MDLFTYLMAKKGHNTGKDLFSYLLGKKASGGSGTYTTFSGTSLNISNTLQAKIKNIALEGNTSQDGTPTPDTPIPIKVVTGEQNITIQNKNLFDKDNANIINGYIQTGNTTLLSNGPTNKLIWINIKNSTTYTISKKVFGSSSRFGIATSVEEPATGISISNAIQQNNYNYLTVTSGQNDKYLIVYPWTRNNTYTLEDVLDTIQIEEDSTATKYEPYYTPQSYPISLGNIELCKMGNYQDYIYNDNGNWYIKRNIIKTTLNNNVANISTYWLSSRKVYGAAIPKSVLGISATTALRQSLCTMSKVVSSNSTVGENTYMFNASANNVYFFNSTFSTVAIANEALTGAVVYCNLDNPIIEKITDTTLIQQLENINNNARSYKDTTIIECTSESTDNEVIGFSGDIKVTSVSLGNSLNTSLLSSNIQEEPNLDDVNEIEEIEEPIEEEVS